MASDRAAWRTAVCTGAALQEEMLRAEWEEKHDRRKQRMCQTIWAKRVSGFCPLNSYASAMFLGPRGTPMNVDTVRVDVIDLIALTVG